MAYLINGQHNNYASFTELSKPYNH